MFDQDGFAKIVEVNSGQILNHLNFKRTVRSAEFSPDGNFFAVAVEKHILIYEAPTD